MDSIKAKIMGLERENHAYITEVVFSCVGKRERVTILACPLWVGLPSQVVGKHPLARVLAWQSLLKRLVTRGLTMP